MGIIDSGRAIHIRSRPSWSQQYASASKGLINRAAGIDRLDYHLDQELEHLVRSADGAEFAEGIGAFFEKRAPVFAGSVQPTGEVL